jgi:hypothetical protein
MPAKGTLPYAHAANFRRAPVAGIAQKKEDAARQGAEQGFNDVSMVDRRTEADRST